MSVHVITASAGSGKTYRLSEVLEEAVVQGRARPEGIVATTFTNQAAAELVERARARLLRSSEPERAHRLLAARIGTVNAVCGSFVSDFAFELGISPGLRVLDPASAELELRRALARVVSPERFDTLARHQRRFDMQLEWRFEVRQLIEAARANGLDADGLRACAQRSRDDLASCLGPTEDGDAIERALAAAIEELMASIDTEVDTTKATSRYLEMLSSAGRDLQRGRLSWGGWAKLATKAPAVKSGKGIAGPLQAIAARHVAHSRLRAEMNEFIGMLFEAAADGLDAYQAHKRERGVIDFVDQETLALQLLRREDVRDELRGQVDLVLIDEFQDTSPIQLAIFLELARVATRSVWVGDPKQAIFGFRGTDPTLMDAAIESLTSPTHDPDLVKRATDAIAGGPLETLPNSYRSRPELVGVTNDIFAKAFAHQGMPEERTRLVPALDPEPAGLGPVLEYWPIEVPGQGNKGNRAASIAAGVSGLLTRTPCVRERADDTVRVARPGDVAVLCRTNEECHLVATALADVGVAAVVPRMRLFDTAEAKLVLAGIRLWVDPRDSLAMAEIARVVTYPTDLDGLVSRALEAPGREAFVEDSAVKQVLAARTARPDAGVTDALDALFDALDLLELCASWGGTPQRTANLDAIRNHAVNYVEERQARREAPTLVGLLAYFADMVDDFGWQNSRTDSQALVGGADAVTVSTWHRAKGLEWPIVVLTGMESIRGPRAHGVHVISDRTEFDLEDPLAERWVRFWPNPYTNANQNGAVRDAFEVSPGFAELRAKADREALRVLYVGWTRARDRLVLAAQSKKLFKGIIGKLTDIDTGLLTVPTVDKPTVWAGRTVFPDIWPTSPAEAVEKELQPGDRWIPAGPTAYPVATATPSGLAAAGRAGEPRRIGHRLPLVGRPDMRLVGEALHGFLAADRLERAAEERQNVARGLLARWGVTGHLAPGDLLAASDALQRWIATSWPGAEQRAEWSIHDRLESGTVLNGVADLVLELAETFVVVDHKSYPGSDADALVKASTFAGQLGAYVDAIARATGKVCAGTFIHLPVTGLMVPVSGK